MQPAISFDDLALSVVCAELAPTSARIAEHLEMAK